MSQEKQLYTISIYTENNIGLLNRISAIFQRRHINVESLNTSPSEIEGVSKFTILIRMSEENIKKIIGQIEKQVEVIKAYYHTEDETIYQESCMFKIKSDLLFNERQIQNIIKESNARIVTVNKQFFVIEKSGKKEEIDLSICCRHIGIYAYRVSFFKKYSQMDNSILEEAEKLEQLTFLNEGVDIHVELACGSTGYGIDTKDDLIKVKKELKK